MTIYWLLLTFPMIAALANSGRKLDFSPRVVPYLLLFWVFYNVVSGLRYDTGGDWYTYNLMVENISYYDFSEALNETDLLFGATAYVSTRLGLGLYGVNFVCSALLSWGVLKLAWRLPDPWISVAASFPYLMIVVGYGYIRQAAAIGLVLVAICHLSDRRLIRTFVYLAMAALFHIGAVVVLPLIGFALMRRNFLAMIGIGIVAMILYFFVLAAQLESFQFGYVEQGYSSGGAFVRLLMSLIPAVLFIILQKRIKMNELDHAVWMGFSLATVACFAALFISASSTAVDRVGLFFLPIQVFMFGHLSGILGSGNKAIARFVTFGLMAYIFLIQYVWLTEADHAFLWVPYKWILQSTG